MARRKQRAPRRAPAFDSDDVEESVMQNEDLKRKDLAIVEKPLSTSDFRKDHQSEDEQCSTTAEFSETDSDSHVHESNDALSDGERISFNNEDQPMKDCVNEGSEKSACRSDSLEQIKAIYNGFLSNSYWSSFGQTPSQSCAEKTSETNSSSDSSPWPNCFDWHQSAIAKTLQQVSEKHLHPQREQSLFSTVQLYRQSSRVYGSIFTGASKFHCKSCSASYDTLVDLTVHMNDTGHYRDDNHELAGKGGKSWSKPRKRSLLELEGKEDAQKVLRCMYCGHSFESLQDLSVHMIKTRHYQKVPLRDPGTSIAAAKVMSSFRKRVPVEIEVSTLNATQQKGASNETLENGNPSKVPDIPKKDSLKEQSGVNNSLQSKSQTVRCTECGQPCESLQQLSDHIMLTGHYVTMSQSQKIDVCLSKQLIKSKMTDDKPQIVTDGSGTSSPTGTLESPVITSPKNRIREEAESKVFLKESKHREQGIDTNVEEIHSTASKFDYLTEEDLNESPKMNLDILKSLENTVTSAINKAQKGTPSWGGYQSIHAAYQLQNKMKPSFYNSGHVSSVKQATHDMEGQTFQDKSQMLISSEPSQKAPSPRMNCHPVEKLVNKVKEKVAEKSIETDERGSLQKQFINSSATSAKRKAASSSPTVETLAVNTFIDLGNNTDKCDLRKGNKGLATSSLEFCDDNAVITVHPEQKQPFVSPLNALQSVMNLHLGKAAKPVRPVQDPMSMLLKMSNNMAERAAVAAVPMSTSKLEQSHPDLHQIDKDQPIDLSKGKRSQSLETTPPSWKVINSSLPATTRTDLTDAILSSPVQESALSDISDMLRNFSDSHVLKSPTPSHKVGHSAIERAHTLNEGDDASIGHKRKGRQSHWNPQHLLILQAQFTSCIRKTADGKYVISDLSPQERMVISRVTGLSMTTISHWLANVKYQLRRTGRTKFLKNLESGHPLFFCSECALQIQTRSAYLCHLESHLGFRMCDLTKFSCENLIRTTSRHSKNLLDKSVLPCLLATDPEHLYTA